MKSHTVPKKLLEQFAYFDAVTRSPRLWHYKKDRQPWGGASPKSATRWDGHFSDPANAAKEAELELRLKQEFEDPVNKFLEMIGSPSFSWNPEYVRLLTGYIRMLFNRSRSRKAASAQNAKNKIAAFRTVLMDEKRISALAQHHAASLIESGISIPRGPWSPRQDVRNALKKQIAERSGPDEPQKDYIQALETMMTLSDDTMLNGVWAILYTDAEHPFVIGDAPVVTWKRMNNDKIYFGIGFARPNVEVFLPVSPTACIYVIPRVVRTRMPQMPSPTEVNRAQAAFATEHCFANVCSSALDDVLQPYFGKMRMGIDGFNLNHINASDALFEILMNEGSA